MPDKHTSTTFGCDMDAGRDLTAEAKILGGRVINARLAPRQDPLTKKSQVLLVLRAGGRITGGYRPSLLQLLDADGNPIPAWQTALRAAQLSSETPPTQAGETP